MRLVSNEKHLGLQWRVLLVQVPLRISIKISQSLEWSAAAVGNVKPDTPWDSADPDLLPSIESRMSFLRHYAIALISTEIWVNRNMSLRDKFKHARFWEHTGTSSGMTESRNGVMWETKRIERIDAVQDIGFTFIRGEEISEESMYIMLCLSSPEMDTRVICC